MSTLLAKKEQPMPMATNDEAHETLTNDPEIAAFPRISSRTSEYTDSSSQVTVLTGAGDNAAQNAHVLVHNTNETWINKKWRPVMGWVYMAICICDFIIFPILWSILQTTKTGQASQPYQPLTLQGAGLIHLAFGAILGIAAFGRTKEKLLDKS